MGLVWGESLLAEGGKSPIKIPKGLAFSFLNYYSVWSNVAQS